MSVDDVRSLGPEEAYQPGEGDSILARGDLACQFRDVQQPDLCRLALRFDASLRARSGTGNQAALPTAAGYPGDRCQRVALRAAIRHPRDDVHDADLLYRVYHAYRYCWPTSFTWYPSSRRRAAVCR